MFEKLYKGFSAIAESQGDTDWTNSDKLLSLVDIKNESNGFYFTSEYPAALSGYEMILNAAEHKDVSKLPRPTQQALQYISKLSREKQCNVSFQSNHLEDRAPVLYKEDTLILPEEKLLSARKTLFGTIERVGGIAPKIRMTTFAGNKITADVSESIAVKAAAFLYQTVKVEAEVTWTYGSESEAFNSVNIIDVQSHSVRNNSDLFAGLKERLGDYSNKYGEYQSHEK